MVTYIISCLHLVVEVGEISETSSCLREYVYVCMENEHDAIVDAGKEDGSSQGPQQYR